MNANLLNAVMANAKLAERLASMPADEKTIVLSGDDSDMVTAHPDWKKNSNSTDASPAETQSIGSNNETIDFSVVDSYSERNLSIEIATDPSDPSYVPLRRLGTLSSGRSCDADYRLVGELGSGGTGIVFQAHQRAIDREVAIKVLRDQLAVDPVSRSRFLTEARVIGGLDHPNVIALHELCVDEKGSLFYSMKRIDGTSWDGQISELSVTENVQILTRVGDAIRYAHSRGLIHRDIKPENVMLGRFGEVLLADWGLAISHKGDESIDASIHHSIGGTPAYMAPELALGDYTQIDITTDVYLLGAILFHILTGYPPHHGETLLECIHAASRNKIRPTNVQGELMDIAVRAMATEPRDRYHDVDAFLAALQSQREHHDSTRLVNRAKECLKTASAQNHYEGYRLADALVREALQVWPDNSRAREFEVQLSLDFARAATDQGDLDLALSLFESAGHADSEAAARVRRKRDKREQKLERESRYSVLFTHSPEAGLLIRMSSGRVVEANQAFSELFGYREDEVVGNLMSELNLWVCPQRRNALIDELQRTKYIDNFEAKFQHRDGRHIDVLISGRIAKLRDEEMVISSIRDISMRKQAEEDLKKSQRRLRDLQRIAGLATWSYDAVTKEVTWSEEAFHLAGRNLEQGVPSRSEYIEMIHPDDRIPMNEAIDAAIKSGASYEVRVRQRGGDGKYHSLIIRGQPILDEDGKTIEIYGVLMPEFR